MARLFGRDYARSDLLERVGQLSQLAGAREYRLQGGPADGTHAIDVYTGSGFRFTVLPGRGMDVSHASYKGLPLGWISPAGEVSPWAYDPEGLGWLRTFAGGLLTTCGLAHAGHPQEDAGKRYGLHGRASTLVASNVVADGKWEGDSYRMWVKGRTREAALYDDQLEMQRTITAELGGKSLRIEDSVTNVGHMRSPHLMLYHINLGFPLLGRDAALVSTAVETKSRDAEAAKSDEGPDRFVEPTAGYREKVYARSVKADRDGMAHVALVNERLATGPLGLRISFRRAELPELNEWKMLGKGEYVLGLEPVTPGTLDRVAARESGKLVHLEPDATREYVVEIGVLDGAEEIAAFRRLCEGVVGGS